MQVKTSHQSFQTFQTCVLQFPSASRFPDQRSVLNTEYKYVYVRSVFELCTVLLLRMQSCVFFERRMEAT